MKLKRRRAQEVPPKIRSFINNVTATPLENIQEPLKSFFWEFEKGDFHHWVELFNHFDSFFEKHIKSRKDLLLENYCLEPDPPFPKEAVLQVLRVIRIILENCSNKHLYTSYVQHLSLLLASTDADIVEDALQTLAAFLKKTVGKYSIKDASLNSKLFALAQGWGGKEEGLGLISCATQHWCDPVAYDLGCSLHFEFYAVNESLNESDMAEKSSQGLQIIHIPFVNSRQETDLELLNKLVTDYKVPNNLRFALLTRLRFARAFSSLTTRQQFTCIRLYAFIVLVQAGGDADDLASLFNSEPEFIDELVSLLSYEDIVSVKIRTLSLLSLVALCQNRSRQQSVLTAVTSGGHRGILSSLMQKAIDSVVSNSSKWPVVFAEALLSLVTALVSSSSGCSAMREAGFIPTLLPLLKDTNPQHLHLVSTAVHILEAFMDYSNTATSLFRDLGGLDDTISRLKVEVSCVDNDLQQKSEGISSGMSTQNASSSSTDLEDIQPLYSEALLSYNRKLLIKALLHAISLGTYPPGNTSRVCGSEESLLPECLCLIFKKARDFGGGVFSLAATVMSDLLHKDPTCFPIIDAAGLPSAFLDAIMDGVLCSAEAVTCIPQCLDALCLNSNGLQAVKDRNALRCFVKIFTSRTYLRALAGETPGLLSGGLDELMRHASSLRGPGVDMLIEILTTITRIGSSTEASSFLTGSPSCSTVPMETDVDDKSRDIADERESPRMDNSCMAAVPSDASAVDTESFLPDCVSNVSRLLETILQNSDTCRIFVDKKGIEAVLQLFTLPLMPLSVSVWQNVSVAFKNFSPQHSASLARELCSFLRGHLKTTDELLSSIGDAQLAVVECAKQTKILRCLSGLEGILSLSNFLLKGTASVVSELGATDADVLKDLGRIYKEIIWQISVCSDSKVDETKNVLQELENVEAASSCGRENDDDASIGVVRHMNPLATSTGSQPIWGGERDFLTVVRSGEHFNRRSRYGFSRVRGGRASRQLEALSIDSDVPSSVPETSSQDLRKKSPEVLILEILSKVASTMRSFFMALVKGFTSSYRRRTDSGSLSLASKNLGTALAKVFFEALSFSGHSVAGLDMSLSVKCRYLGKVVHDMAALIFDSRRRSCYPIMVNSFYVHGTLKELLTTFEATSQLLWTLPVSIPTSSADQEKGGDESKLSSKRWLLDTLQSYCQVLEYFVNSALILSSSPASQAQLVVQPVAVGLSIGLFPVPKDPEAFVRMLQSQVLEVILPVWNNSMFPNCHPAFIASIILLVNHIYSGVGDVKHHRASASASTIQRVVPPPDESTISTIVEMGFSRARAEAALRRVGSNSVELAMEWLISHAEDPVQEDGELARALALSLGNSSETSKGDAVDKSVDVAAEDGQAKALPVDNILIASVNMFLCSGSVAFPLSDLFVTLCNRDKGVDRQKVVSHLIQQLKLCPLDYSKDTSAISMLSHIIALILSEDVASREIAADNGVVSTIIDILTNFKTQNELGSEIPAPKCISVLLLILDNMVQLRPLMFAKSKEESPLVNIADLSGDHVPFSDSSSVEEKKSIMDGHEGEPASAFEKILGKPTGYLTTEESHKALVITCDLIKQQVPALIMQASLQLCARLTKTHSLASQFLENGGLAALFNLPKRCIFPGFDNVASSIVRHLLEDPQTLQTSMELEIRQNLSGNRNAGRVSPRTFLTSMAPVISRDPMVFMKSATSICQLESSGGRTYVVLSKEKDKEKDKLKASGADPSLPSHESIKISENKIHDGLGKYSKGHKRIPANLTQVVDHLLELILKYQPVKMKDDCAANSDVMEIDDLATRSKGKSKVDETKETESEFDKYSVLATVTFVLKLLSDILLMYTHAAGLILRRDLEFSHLNGSNLSDGPHVGLLHHVLHQLLPISSNRSAGPAEWRDRLSEKASWFLVVLCGRSGEGRRRVIGELVKALSSFSDVESYSGNNSLLPDKRVRAFAELAYSILSKSSSSSNLPGSSCSPDVARSMIDGGIIKCLTDILQVTDLDHPDAPKVVNLLLKALEILTRAANASDQVSKSDVTTKKKYRGLNERSETPEIAASASENVEHNHNASHQQVTSAAEAEQPSQRDASPHDGNHDNLNRSEGQIVQGEAEEAMGTNPAMQLGMDFLREDIEGNNTDHIEMTFRVENQADDDMGDEDDDMADDGEDDEDDEEGEGEDEDEDIAEDGAGMMSLADTDVEDHEDTGLGDEFNEDMIDEEDDEFQGNRVIEVRWREALDGLDQVFGQSGSGGGLIDVAAEPFEGVNIDDLFGIRRPLGFERRRQSNRSFERPTAEANGFQHPLLARPSQSRDLASIWSSAVNSSRGLEAGSSGTFGLTHLQMFDPPVNPHENAPGSLFSDRLGSAAPPPLSDYSVGMDTIRLPRRRGSTDGRWTDDGQPQAITQAAAIAQSVEEEFVSQLRSVTPSSSPAERHPQHSGVQEKEQPDAPSSNAGQIAVAGNDTGSPQHQCPHEEISNGTVQQEINQVTESVSSQEQVNSGPVVQETHEDSQEPMSDQPTSANIRSNVVDMMEIVDPNGSDSRTEDGRQEPISGSVDVHANLQYEEDPDVPLVPHELSTAGSDDFSRVNNGGSIDAAHSGLETSNRIENQESSVNACIDVDMNDGEAEYNESEHATPAYEFVVDDPLSRQDTALSEGNNQAEQSSINNEASGANAIDPTFLEALPEDLRAEVLASRQAQSVQPPAYVPPSMEDIDPEFLAALPPDIQAEVLAQQRAQRVMQQAEGQPVEMDNASIIATLPPDLREEVLLTSSDAVLSALPSPLLAEAQMLRDRAMSHYQARSLFGTSHRLINRRNGLGFERQAATDRGVGFTIRRAATAIANGLKMKEVEGEPVVDINGLKALIRLLRLAQPLGKGLLQRILLNLCAHNITRENLVFILLDMIKPEAEGSARGLATVNSQRLYGCRSSVVYCRSQLLDGLPPLVLRRALEILTYLATNHSSVANMLFYLDRSVAPKTANTDPEKHKSKEKAVEGVPLSTSDWNSEDENIPLRLFFKLLNRPLLTVSSAHLEQVMGLIQVIVYTAASKLESQSPSKPQVDSGVQTLPSSEASDDVSQDPPLLASECNGAEKDASSELPESDKRKNINVYGTFLRLPSSDLHNLCALLGHEGLSDKVYMLAGEVLQKLSEVAAPHRSFFTSELSELAQGLSNSAVSELITLNNTNMLGLSAGSMAGAAILRVLQALNSLTSSTVKESVSTEGDWKQEEQATMFKLNAALEPLWRELSNCITVTESQLDKNTSDLTMPDINLADFIHGTFSLSPPLPPGTHRLLPFIEAFFVLCERLQANTPLLQQDQASVTATEIKESTSSSALCATNTSGELPKKLDGVVTFSRFAEKHRRLLNAFIRQNPGLLEKSLSMMLKTPRLIDFDNKRAYFRSRVRQQNEHHLSGPLRISVRRAYILEDSYNQLRMRPSHDLKGRLNVHFQGEEGIDAGGLTREWYQLLSRVIFDKGALLFTTVGNNATFQPNPNSVYQTEHLSYFRFVGRVVAKALYDGQHLDIYFTRSFYKHILGSKVTYHDIEAVDPDYYKNLKWMLENDVSDIPDLTFSMDADEEKHILYEKNQVTDYELKPGGRNIRVTEETKHEYVDLVADHILTNAIRPQINAFLEGFNELVPRELISMFNDKELELLISGLPEIDLDDLRANTEYTGYTTASAVIQWFWDVVKDFSKEDMARLLQFVTGTSKVPLEGFKALQGISGPQRFQIHKAYGAPERLPSAHTCFNQLDLPEYSLKEQLEERLMIAIHEASEGFGFG